MKNALTRPDQAPTVLVVEDDDDTRDSIRELLEERGYQVVAASNGRDAHTYLRQSTPPACVLLDLWMPVMDGWALAAEMTRGHLPRVPLVVITAAEPHWGYPAPHSRVVRKPLNPARILAVVAEAVRGNA